MVARTVISLVVDLIGSTARGLEFDAASFRRYNKAIAKHIWPYIRQFDLESSTLKFTGDGWLLFQHDLEKAHAIVALAKTLSANFQSDLGTELGISPAQVPPLRLAVCTGDDEEVEFGIGARKQKDWIGDSARRATRASGCCAPNELIVNSTIRDKIYRVFSIGLIDISKLSPDRQPKRWEENFQVYSVGEIRHDFVRELRHEPDPSAYAPYIAYLDFVGKPAQAKAVAETTSEAIIVKATEQAEGLVVPTKTAALENAGALLRNILYSSPSRTTRDAVLSRMKRIGEAPSIVVYNGLLAKSLNHRAALEVFESIKSSGLSPDVFTYSILINLSPDYATAKGWFDAMLKAGVKPDEVTYSTLINLSPDYATAKGWFDAMLKAGVKPNEVTFNTLIKLSPDYATAKGWFDAMLKAGVKPDEVTFNTLIKLSPDYATAKGWFDAMLKAGVKPDEVTAVTLTKFINSKDEGQRLTDELVKNSVFIGQGYFAALYSKLAPQMAAEELLAFHVRQKFRPSAALGAAIRAFADKRRIDDACRVALAFPFLEAARKVFRGHNDFAVKYYRDLLARDFEPYNCTYALGYCFLENGNTSEALRYFRLALQSAKQAERIEDIERRIREIESEQDPGERNH
jgi:class 3 adenylate cyclase